MDSLDVEVITSEEENNLVIVEDGEEEIPSVFRLSSEIVNPTVKDDELKEHQERKARKRSHEGDTGSHKKDKKEKKEKSKKEKTKKEKKIKNCDGNVRGPNSPQASTSRETIGSPVASTSQIDLFEEDDEVSQFLMSQNSEEDLLIKVQNSEELGVSTTPKTQLTLSKEEKLMGHITFLVKDNENSADPVKKAWSKLATAEKRGLAVIQRFQGSKEKGSTLRVTVSNFNQEEAKMNSSVLREWKTALFECQTAVNAKLNETNLDKVNQVFFQTEAINIKSAIVDVVSLEKELDDINFLFNQMTAALKVKFEEKMSKMSVRAAAVKQSLKGIKGKFTKIVDLDFKPPE